jgi:hypothetical protein
MIWATILSVISFLFRVSVLFFFLAAMWPNKPKREPKNWACGRTIKREKRRFAPVIQAEIDAPTLPFD